MNMLSLVSKLNPSLQLHKTIMAIEDLNGKWKMENIPFEHTYGRIPGEKEIRMWSIPRSTIELLSFLAILQNAKVIIDVGTSAGYSAIWLAIAAKITGGHVYTIENFEPKIEAAQKYIKQSTLQDYITLIQGDAKDVLSNWDGKKTIDFTLLDADKENYGVYLRTLIPHLNKNGVVVADNAGNFRHLMMDFISLAETRDDLISHFLNIDNGLMIITKRD